MLIYFLAFNITVICLLDDNAEVKFITKFLNSERLRFNMPYGPFFEFEFMKQC